MKKVEANNDWVADADTTKIAKCKTPTDVTTLGIGYNGCYINDSLEFKKLNWRGNIVLMLIPHRFCETVTPDTSQSCFPDLQYCLLGVN